MSMQKRLAPVAELRRDFGLDAQTLVARPDGFESDCWVVDDRWFVKVWHNGDHHVDLALLQRLADHGLPVPVPLRSDVTRTGSGRPYAVFPFVRGRHATGDDWAEVARMLRRVHDVASESIGLQTSPLNDEPLVQLRQRLDHPWIAGRADELSEWLDRLEAILNRARAADVPVGLSHDDFGGHNVIVDDDGRVAAIVDWDWARLGPREHDLWLVIDETHPQEFLGAYGAAALDLNVAHLEYGLLVRALGDLAARVVDAVDQPGLTTWGFDRLARVKEILALFV